MDILGTENTLAVHSVVPANVTYPWSNTTRSTMKIQRSEISNEDDAKLVRISRSALVFVTDLARLAELAGKCAGNVRCGEQERDQRIRELTCSTLSSPYSVAD